MTVVVQHWDRRVTDFITLPRARVEESLMDVHAGLVELRETLGDAHRDLLDRRDPRHALFDADGQIVQLDNHARRNAAEAAGITFISVDQQSLWDGCLDGADGERGA